MEISIETIESWTEDRCNEVWPQIVEAYTPAISSHVHRRLKETTSPRRSLVLFAKYFNGEGKERVLRRRKQLELQREFSTFQQAVAKLFHIPEEVLAEKGRHPRVVAARMFIVHIMHRRGMAYPKICEMMLGHTSHASVITADQRLQRALIDGDKFEVWDGEQFVRLTGAEIIERLTNAN